MKQCTKCNAELKPTNIGAVDVDECQSCKGVWFDKGELRQAKDITDSDLNWMDFEIWKDPDQFKSKDSLLKCPACKEPTKAIHYGATGVEVDYCPACKGVWLDKGELQKIVDALNQDLLTKSFSKYISESIKEATEIVTGPESLISEWKDFATVLRMMQYRFFVEHPKILDQVIAAEKTRPF